MPHAEHDEMDERDQDAADELLIQQALDPQSGLNFDRELDRGEKADDAIDYEDISDDDLADDDDDANPAATTGASSKVQDGDDGLFSMDLGDGTGLEELGINAGGMEDNLDDLFGDVPHSPVDGDGITANTNGNVPFGLEAADSVFGDPLGPVHDDETASIDLNGINVPFPNDGDLMMDLDAAPLVNEQTEEELLQRQLFAMSNHPPAPPENQQELLQSLWPGFEADKIPRFFDLLRKRKVRYIGKTPSKPPKPVQPTKISLELEPDQEKAFKVSNSTANRPTENSEEHGTIPVLKSQSQQAAEDEEADEESDYENEPVGGVSWQDFQVLCEDWDIPSTPASLPEAASPPTPSDDLFGPDDLEEPSSKRRKLDGVSSTLDVPRFSLGSIQDYQRAMQKAAGAVTLDLNDPYLLVDRTQPSVDVAKKSGRKDQKQLDQTSKRLAKRYNISNDAAYDLLKENHQSRIRSTIGQPTLSHTGPALRLQYPYYKTKLHRKDARTWHRPMAEFIKNEPITFEVPISIKKKHVKKKDAKTLFNKTEDLSLKDNANVILLEYSEEHPAIMSNFGMGSKIMNYYRKRTPEDAERPKREIGELEALLPEDKSPFSIFGHVDAGEVVSAIYNALYRAPVFEQTPRTTDFLMTRLGNRSEGRHWYMRNIEHLRVVGQQFPLQEVPKPNGRKVSTAAKNRTKMIAYRLMRRKENGRILIPEVTKHTSEASDMQLRQKLKEFLQYHKDNKDWGTIDNRPIPDEETARAGIPPEDACLVESVQVGQQHLEDAGYSKQGGDEIEEELDENQGQSVEEQLAPWHTTKNFQLASAGKAMLQLHGEGDPSSRGEAFSLLKISMKGGFKPIGESVEDKISAKRRKELGGHSYNVAEQTQAYQNAIRRIWDAQTLSLSTTIEHSDAEMDVDDVEERGESLPRGTTPHSEAQPPAVAAAAVAAARSRRGGDDETMSQFSKFSSNSQSGRVLRISRKVRNEHGEVEVREELVRDPKVIHQYLKRKQLQQVEGIDFKRIRSADVENNPIVRKQLEAELGRLERNKDRRLTREKQKAGAAGSPEAPTSPGGTDTPGKPAGTQRKCANCGQIGHIRTNKKLCPLLNGTMKQEDGFGDSSFSMTTPTL